MKALAATKCENTNIGGIPPNPEQLARSTPEFNRSHSELAGQM